MQSPNRGVYYAHWLGIAAANYQHLRRRGVTLRTTVDLLIGTFCIERGHALLHNDRDFAPMERFLGLRTI